MIDSSSSRTMNLDYLAMDPCLRIDDLDLLAEFKNCCHSNRYMDANIVIKMFKILINQTPLLGSCARSNHNILLPNIPYLPSLIMILLNIIHVIHFQVLP